MAKDLNKVLVIDLEATCWDSDPPPGQKNEIIEIGLCVLDLKTGEREKHGRLVKPVESRVSEFCTSLTTITQEMVDSEGISLQDALHWLNEFKPRKRAWASWGDYDRVQFDRECQRKALTVPFGRTHLNIKHLFAVMTGLSREIGVGQALEKVNTTFEGTPHRGADDAWNIAGIYARILGVGDESRIPETRVRKSGA